jgi:TRAP-type mannitol/chloroaromatic compound transport system permease large subunit
MPSNPPASRVTDRLALSATLHCLTGCSIGEILGMVAGGTLHWPNLPTVALSIVLAFAFGYAFTLNPLLRAGLAFRRAAGLAFASDTLSITIMEIVDNAIMLVVPGAMDAHPTTRLFWGSMVASLVLAGIAAYPVNRWLIARGRGHALVHAHHAESGHPGEHAAHLHASMPGSTPAAPPAPHHHPKHD